MQSIIESGKSYLNPDPELQRFLVPFTVGANKIKLYGNPNLMISKSELIKSLIDKLSTTEINPLAINQEIIQSNGLIIVWLFMNNVVALPPTTIDAKDYLDIWQWLNYFDVPYNSDFVKDYIKNLFLPTYIKQLMAPENKGILADILIKVRIINPLVYSSLTNGHINLVLTSSTGIDKEFR